MSDIRYWVDRGFSCPRIKKMRLIKETPKQVVCMEVGSSFKWEQHLRKSEEFIFTELAHAQEKYVFLMQRIIESKRESILALERDMAQTLEESKGLA